MHFAVHRLGRKDVVELLLASNADASASDKGGWTPLHFAADSNRKDLAELLLASKADVNARDKGGKTPFDYALAIGYDDVTRLLREHGAHE